MTVAGIALVALIGLSQAQSPDTRASFEVTSVKLNKNCGLPGGPGRGRSTPGRATLECAELRDLIRAAYGINANGKTQDPKAFLMQVEGGPGWIDSEQYSIEAKAEGNPPGTEITGPRCRDYSKTGSN
jgi:uncharacterized protein (TIGR03435 family)